MAVEYEIGEELDDLEITWPNPKTGTPRLLASGWTFELKIGQLDQVAILTKTTGITGADTFPNVVVVWAPGELDIASGDYVGQIRARNGATKDLIGQFAFPVKKVVT